MMAAWWLYYGDTVVVVGVVEWQLRQIVNEATRWWKRYYNGGGAAMVEGCESGVGNVKKGT